MPRPNHRLRTLTRILGLLLLGVAGVASAQTTGWIGTASSSWNDPTNWNGGLPDNTKDVTINHDFLVTYDPVLDTNAEGKNLYIGMGANTTLTIPSNYSLTVSQIYLGQATGTTSEIVQSDGTLTCNGYIWAGSTGNNGKDPTQTGSGNYTMTGGTLNANNFDFGQLGTCTFYQSGGEVNVGFVALGENYYRYENGIPATYGQTICTLEGNAVFNVPEDNPAPGAGNVHVGLWGGNAELTVQGSAVMNATNITVDSPDAGSYDAGAVGVINLHANGQIILSGNLTLSGDTDSTGTLNQDGGTLTVQKLDGGAGTYTHNFTGGTLNVSQIANMDLVNGGGTVNIGGPGALATLSTSTLEVTNNIALGKTATESSEVAPAPNAVDGNFGNYAHTGYEENAWWQVDLTGGGTTSVQNVFLTARDNYPGFLSNFYVRVLADDGATVLWQDKFITDVSDLLENRERLWVHLPSAVDGRYVQVQLDGYNLNPWEWDWSGYLVFAECEVGDGGYVYSGDYSQNADSTLGIELDPTGGLCDKLDVGTLTLDGTLDVTSLGGSFSAGQVFDIFDWDTLVGTFDTVNLPALSGGLTWDASDLYVTGELAIVSSVLIPGDTDGNLIVDELDAQKLAQNWGADVGEGGFAAGDFNGDHWVNAADAAILAANWGNHAGEAAGVPEPGALVLLLMGAAALAAPTRRGRRAS